MTAPCDIVLVERGHTAFGMVAGRAMIQVRAGMMTHAILDAVEKSVFPRVRAATRPAGALIVLNGDAQVPPADVRSRQQALVGGLLDEMGAFMVSVVEGNTIQATSMRTVTRVLVLGKPGLVHRADVPSAAEWLSGKLGVPAADLVAGVADVRKAIGGGGAT